MAIFINYRILVSVLNVFIMEDNKKSVKCKYGCGATFSRTPKGRTDYMRHCKYSCPMNPSVKRRKEKAKKVKEKKVAPSKKVEQKAEYTPLTEPEKELTEEDRLDEEQVLDKIIAEASMTRKRPAIVRMVRYVIGRKKESIRALAEALRIGDIAPSQRNLILRNWARHLEIEDVDHILKKDKEIDIEEEGEEEKRKKKTTIDKYEDLRKMMRERKLERLSDLQLDKDIRDYERELSGETKKEAEEKHTLIVDGVSLSVTPEQMMSWKRYLAEEKRAEEEREERRQRNEEKHSRKDDDIVEWPIDGDKVIKVKESTIPILLMQQVQKKDNSSEEVKALRDQFQQFQTNVLHKEIEELKMQVAINPIDRLINDKNKFEQLGLVTSGKTSAQERMYSMEGKKLDTMLALVTDTSKSFKERVDVLIDILRPLGAEYVKNALKRQRGPGEPVTRTEAELEAQAKEILKKLDASDNSMTEMNTETRKSPSVVTIPKTKKKPDETGETTQ